MRIFHNVEQNSDEWFNVRLGKITASNFGTIMANYGKAFGEPAKKYAMRTALESVIKTVLPTYKNNNTERGHELEPIAREIYENDTFTEVLQGGFMEFGRFGASSDGLVNPDGSIEIKSVLYNTHFERIINGGFDTSYQWQIHGNIWIYERKWCDFVSYCPEFPYQKNLHIFRVERDEEKIKMLEERLNEFVSLVDTYKEKLKN